MIQEFIVRVIRNNKALQYRCVVRFVKRGKTIKGTIRLIQNKDEVGYELGNVVGKSLAKTFTLSKNMNTISAVKSIFNEDSNVEITQVIRHKISARFQTPWRSGLGANPLTKKHYVAKGVPRNSFDEKKSKLHNVKDFIVYQVFYGTNRNLIKNQDLLFGSSRGDELYVGVCNVSIPKNHKVGKVERPNWFIEIVLGESPKKYFTILDNSVLSKDNYVEALNLKITESSENDILLFIHGYNTSFEESNFRAAQLGYDLNFKGAVATYSWPALNGLLNKVQYMADEASARASTTYLEKYFDILLSSNVKRLYIIAHSMGNLLLTETLKSITSKQQLLPVLKETIFAAPDIDKDIFINDFSKYGNNCRYTLYASDNDKALSVSKTLRSGYVRCGEGGENLTAIEGLDSIDASRVNTNLLGHGYFSESQSLINDIHSVISGLTPDKRILDEQFLLDNVGVNRRCWKFRAN